MGQHGKLIDTCQQCLAQDALSKGCMPERNPPLVVFVLFFGLGGSSPNQFSRASVSSVFLPGSCWNSSLLALGASTLTRWKFFTIGHLKNFVPACRLCKRYGRPTAKTRRTLIWTNSTILGPSKAGNIILCVFSAFLLCFVGHKATEPWMWDDFAMELTIFTACIT